MKVDTPPSIRPPFLTGASRQFDWSPVIGAYVHEVKVVIIEALSWIGGPLSAKELWLILGPEQYEYQTILHHVNSLAKHKCIEPAGDRQARGAKEKYYVLSPAPGLSAT
jgi:hypothetical protein